MYDNLRFTAANGRSPLAKAILRSAQAGGGIYVPTVDDMREAGFRALSPLSDKAQVVAERASVGMGSGVEGWWRDSRHVARRARREQPDGSQASSLADLLHA